MQTSPRINGSLGRLLGAICVLSIVAMSCSSGEVIDVVEAPDVAGAADSELRDEQAFAADIRQTDELIEFLAAISGMVVTPQLDQSGMVSSERAVEAARAEYRFDELKADLAAHLVKVEKSGGGPERDGQSLWVVVATGFEVTQGAPVLPDGSPAEVPALTRAMVFIDAATGEYLYDTWSE